MNATQPYLGPVLYIIHAPKEYPLQFFNENDKTNLKANKKHILDALNRAGIRKIPVVFEMHYEAEYIKKIISELKHPPRIIEMPSSSIKNPALIQQVMAKEKINPTKVIGLGIYRDICVIEGLESMKRAFPKAEVILLQGASTLYIDHSKTLTATERKEKRAKYLRRAKRYGIKTAKKLSFKHFAR